MNQILQSKIDELEKADKYECWYLVKQPTAFDSLCYLVSFLIEYKEKKTIENLENYIANRVQDIKPIKPNVEISSNYRALRVAAFFGLITMTSSKYDEAIVTDTFKEIKNRCNGEYEKTELYTDIIQRQIEKMFISSQIDEAYMKARKDYRLYPVMLLYKILIELGRSSGKYSISMTEYRYIVATTKLFEDFLESLLLIKVLREDEANATEIFETFKDKFDNRLIQALKQLDTLIIDKDIIGLNEDKIEEVARKVFIFEENPNVFTTENYLEFLGSRKSLFDLDNLESNENSVEPLFLSFETNYQSDFSRNRILFGAPGTGKSYTLNKECEELLQENKEIDFERVTFHPDYSYANFVGTYKPVMVDNYYETIPSLTETEVVSILTNKTKSAQEKYDLLFDKFKDEGLITRLPLLLGIYTDESFKTRKVDGSESIGDNNVERNHGKAIRPYVNLSKPTSKKKDISYEYVPGPFMRVLVKALKNVMTDKPKPFLLIIEEINRANVAAVFGDVFQLLDRDSNGVSEYKIATTNDMRRYLSEQLGIEESKVESIKIPNNMFIWATMNSADQGVFPMDTAFKRRWDFTYLGIDEAESKMSDEIKKKEFTFGQGDYARMLTWNEIRQAINDELSSETYNINEDKLLGLYFISKSILEGDADSFMKAFKNKVLMYLFDDAVKQKKKTFFENCKDDKKGIRYSELCETFDKKGVFVFPEGIYSKFTKKPTTSEEGAE